MYYVYDSVNDRLLQAENWEHSAGQEIEFRQGENRIYVHGLLVGSSPADAYSRVIQYADREVSLSLDKVEKLMDHANKYMAIKIKALEALGRL